MTYHFLFKTFPVIPSSVSTEQHKTEMRHTRVSHSLGITTNINGRNVDCNASKLYLLTRIDRIFTLMEIDVPRSVGSVFVNCANQQNSPRWVKIYSSIPMQKR